MIRVAHIITGASSGGAQMMLYKLLGEIDRSQYESVVISLKDRGMIGEQIEELGVQVKVLPITKRKTSLIPIAQLISFIRKLKPDVIQGWMYHGNLAASICGMFLPKTVPVVWNVRHSLYDISLEKKFTQRVIRIGASLSKSTAKIIYNSYKSAQQHEEIGYVSERTIVIPNGFDCDRFKPSAASKVSIRKELGVVNKEVLIGLIARYHPMKDHDNLFKAAKIITENYPNVSFVLVGHEIESSNSAIAKMLSLNGIENKVFLLGERQDISEITAGLDIACSSSSYGEGFPNVVGEAMACGVPCVVTDVGDSALIVGDTGIVVPPRNPVAMAKACGKMIEDGLQGRQKLGERARERVIDNFSLDKIVCQYESLYKSIV
jgi:glycosyltransferase involved in cell wall biosynthesis